MLKLKSLFAIAGLCSAMCAIASAQEITWNIGKINAIGSSYEETVDAVPERLAKATHGRLKIKLYDTLVNGPDQPAAVRNGSLDGSFAVNPWLSTEAPLLNVGALPGLLTSVDSYHHMLDPLLRKTMADLWKAKYNARMLATGVFELQCVFSKTPLLTVDKFKGKKIRVHNNSAANLMVQVGAAPTTVPFGEIVPALQRGIVDAVMTSVGTANGMGISNVAKYASVWNIGAVVSWSLVVNENAWASLPDDLKPIVEQEFRKIEDEHYARNAAFNKQAIAKLKKAGMTVDFIPQAEMDKLFSPGNVKPVFDHWYNLSEKSGTDGRALVKQIQELKAKM